MGKYVMKHAKNGLMFNLLAANGEIIASSETYKSTAACVRGIGSIRRNALIAGVEDQTVSDYLSQKHPKFEVYEDKGGKYRFRLKAKNGKIIAVSQAYHVKESCLVGVEAVKMNADSLILDETEEE